MQTRVRSLTECGSSEGVKDVGREQGTKQFENIITRVLEVTLGTRTHIPSGHMVSTLWGQTTLDHNVPSD